MINKRLAQLTRGALIAALYVVLTWLANQLGLANGAIQLRFSEALTVLPAFSTAAVPGLTLGCLLSNLLMGVSVWDILFGTLATLLGAIGTHLLRRHLYLAALPPILANTLILPPVLRLAYGLPEGLPYLMLTVGIGELLSCGILGTMLAYALRPRARRIFPGSIHPIV